MIENPAPDPRRIFVLLDSNTWFNAQFMRSFQGSNLVNLLSGKAGKLILPEIVEREIKRLYISEVQSSVQKATDVLEKIKLFTGVVAAFDLPKNDTAGRSFEELLTSLDAFLERSKFTMDHATFALNMILAKQPPCGSDNEQFRDCCIWKDCVDYGQKGTTFFVTADKAFYEGKQYANGLAGNLLKELREQKSVVQVFPDIASLYKALEPATLQIDADTIAGLIRDKLGPQIISASTSYGFIRATEAAHRIVARPVRQPTRRFISFELDFSLEGPPGDTGRLDPVLTLRGSCAYDVASSDVSDVNLDAASVEWTGIDGRRIKSATHYVTVSETASASTGIASTS